MKKKHRFFLQIKLLKKEKEEQEKKKDALKRNQKC